MSYYDFGNSYFSKSVGFVIDGNRFGYDREGALDYLIETCYLEPAEAECYMNRLYQAYTSRVARARVSA